MWRYTTIPPNLPLINSNISAVALQSANTASQLAALIGQQNANNSGGVTVNENFTQYTSNTLPSQWTVQSGATGIGVYIPNGASFEKGQGINTTIAWYYALHSSEVQFYVRHNTVMKTDSVSIQAVMGTNGQSDKETTLISHASSSLDSFAYANLFNNHIYFGHGSFSAGTFTFNDLANVAYTINNGDRVELKNNGTTWQVNVNGVLALTVTDSGSVISYDSSHRYWGYAQSQGVALITMGDVSFGLQSITASDIAIPATLGTGWKLYRASTSAIAQPGSGNVQLSSGTLDTLGFIANCTQVDTAGLGGVQLTKTGWYTIVFRWATNGTVGFGDVFRALIWTKNAAITDTLTLRAVGISNSGNGTDAMVVISDYFTTGNILYPGVMYNGGTPSVVGDAAGTLTYWEGMLSNA